MLLINPTDVQEGIVLELPAVVNSLPELPEKYKGKISWIEVNQDTAASNACGCL